MSGLLDGKSGSQRSMRTEFPLLRLSQFFSLSRFGEGEGKQLSSTFFKYTESQTMGYFTNLAGQKGIS